MFPKVIFYHKHGIVVVTRKHLKPKTRGWLGLGWNVWDQFALKNAHVFSFQANERAPENPLHGWKYSSSRSAFCSVSGSRWRTPHQTCCRLMVLRCYPNILKWWPNHSSRQTQRKSKLIKTFDSVWNHRQFDCLFNSLSRLITKTRQRKKLVLLALKLRINGS